MPYIMRLVEIGGNLTVTVPRRLARELGLVKRQYVVVGRGNKGELTITTLEDFTRDKRRDTTGPAR